MASLRPSRSIFGEGARSSLSVASGVLLALAYPGRDWDVLAWVALLPLLAVTSRGSARAAFWHGWLAGTVSFLASLSWIAGTIEHYTWLPFVAALVPYVLLAGVLGIYTGAAAMLWSAAAQRGLPLVVAVPIAWVALEWLRSFFPIGFPWLLLGYATHARLTLAQLADLAGVYGLSAAIALTNVAFFNACRRAASVPRRVAWVAFGIGVVACACAYGQWRLATIARSAHSETLRVALVQGNIEQDHKWDPEYQDETLRRYEDLSRQAATVPPDVLVWPETAVPFFFQLDGPDRARVVRAAELARSGLLFGGPAFDYDSAGDAYMTNRAYALDRGGDVDGAYDKQVLVPFGEYVPLRRFLPFINRIVEGAAPFKPGVDQRPLTLGAQRYGVLICYEAIFPDLARRSVRQGATVLANLTNDAWFGRSIAPSQHLAMAVFRAIENRRPLLRAANTGYTAIVGVDGRILQRTALFTTASLTATLSWPRLDSPYTRWGDWFAQLCAVASLIAAVACVIRPRRGISNREAKTHGTE